MKITFSILLLLLIHTDIRSQISDYGSLTEIHEIVSKENKLYNLKVTLPKNYDNTKAYKTIYYLDSWWLSEIVLGSYAILYVSKKIDDVILVGITINGDSKDWNLQRSLDFTPSGYNFEIMGITMKVDHGKNKFELVPNNTGGANSFLEFLETKVIVYIEEKYPNANLNRCLIGHSLGGLFSVYAIQQKPQLFSDFIIISPSLWWNKSELLQKTFFTKFSESQNPVNIHLSYGDYESKLITRSNIKLNEILKGLEKEKLDYQFINYERADHISILPQAIYDGLLYLYGN